MYDGRQTWLEMAPSLSMVSISSGLRTDLVGIENCPICTILVHFFIILVQLGAAATPIPTRAQIFFGANPTLREMRVVVAVNFMGKLLSLHCFGAIALQLRLRR
jgi:hypothetical protein